MTNCKKCSKFNRKSLEVNKVFWCDFKKLWLSSTKQNCTNVFYVSETFYLDNRLIKVQDIDSCRFEGNKAFMTKADTKEAIEISEGE